MANYLRKIQSVILISLIPGIFFTDFSFAETDIEVKSDKKSVFIYNDQGKRDPLWSLVSPSGAIVNYDSDYLITDLKLEGIIFQGDGKDVVIINGKIFQLNGMIGQFQIKEIAKESVILQKAGQTFELKLKKEE